MRCRNRGERGAQRGEASGENGLVFCEDWVESLVLGDTLKRDVRDGLVIKAVGRVLWGARINARDRILVL